MTYAEWAWNRYRDTPSGYAHAAELVMERVELSGERCLGKKCLTEVAFEELPTTEEAEREINKYLAPAYECVHTFGQCWTVMPAEAMPEYRALLADEVVS